MDDRPSIFRPFETPTPAAEPVRQPPANARAEMAFLGALLANNKVLDRVPFLRPQHFADPVNARIFEVASRLIGDRKIADAITLKTIFDEGGTLQEVGGTAYLTSLLSAMVGIVNAADYARVIADSWLRRELIDIADILSAEAFGSGEAVDPTELALRTIAMIDQVTVGSVEQTTKSLDVAMDAALAAMNEAKSRTKPAGLSTGFACLDQRLGGLEPDLVYTLAGRPGSGKSALGHQISLNVARQGVGVLELSLEMSAMQLGRRALAVASGVPLFVMKRGLNTDYDDDRLNVARENLRGLPLTIDDAGGLTPRQIAAQCRAAKRKHGLGLVMLDHLNLTRPDDADIRHGPTFAIERAAGMMLEIAKDCGVPVLMLAQLNRGVEGREDKRPVMADLRQSGAIEENSYAVGFLYREEYYLQNAPQPDEGENDDKFQKRMEKWVDHKNRVAGRAEVIWAKVRDGDPGTDTLRFTGNTTSFVDSL